MTISDPARRPSVLARGLASTLVVLTIAACGQKGPLKLPAQPRAAASAPPSIGTTVPGSSSTEPADSRDPFSNPPPTALPASVPHP